MSAKDRGSYRGPRVRGLPERMGRVYLSRGNEGQPALLQVATGETPHLHLQPVQVLVTALPAPGGVAVQVEGKPPSQGCVTEAVLGALEGAAELVEHIGHGRAVREHLSRERAPGQAAAVRTQPVRPRWLPTLVGAAGVVLLVWPGATVHVQVQAPERPEYTWDMEATASNVAYTDILRGSSTPESWSVRKRIVMPAGPLEGQDTPPCAKGYIAIRGGCWAKLDAKAPHCPERSVEHEGNCYLPIRGERPVPMSIGRERGR
ncbi:hypothetical protein [Myxococcus phage Mx4 ts27htf-1hrm-1]|nr:uridylyltransferase [Myxococcus phage Mx4]WNM70346.1 hypothetical protein [Myxococcus phage Mx4 ts27htf-1hrm-1]